MTCPRESLSLPPLRELGPDLLRVTARERWMSLILPFLCCFGFFLAFESDAWGLAFLCVVAQSFLTYASVSHDLVHQNLGLSRFWNEFFLFLIEALSFRSGHAYRLVHLHHHRSFPHPEDIEGRAAGMSFLQALQEGPTAQFKIWTFALRKARTKNQAWLLLEAVFVLALSIGCALAMSVSYGPIVYLCLCVGGSWFYPIMTAWVVHDTKGSGPLHHTRLFRGRLASLLAFEHLYHLEHHLYPKVPHQRWPELAKRLDPYFAEAGLKPIILIF